MPQQFDLSDIQKKLQDTLDKALSLRDGFKQLEEYSETAISPQAATGLAELQKQASLADKQLKALQSTLASIAANPATAQSGAIAAEVAARKNAQSIILADQKAAAAAYDRILKEEVASEKAANAAKIAADKAAAAAHIAARKEAETAVKEAAAEELVIQKGAIAAQIQLRKEAAAEIEAFNKAELADFKAKVSEEIAANKELSIQQRLQAKEQAEQAFLAAQAIRQESAANAVVLNERKLLSLALADNRIKYGNLVLSGEKERDAAIELLAVIKLQQKQLTDLDKTMGNTRGFIRSLGKDFSTAFNGLRELAYILPGIGIAGIFALAYEPIEAFISSLDLVSDSLTKVTDKETTNNEAILAEINSRKELNELLKNTAELNDSLYKGNSQRSLADIQSGQLNSDELLIEKTRVAQDAYDKALNDVGGLPPSVSGDIIAGGKDKDNTLKKLNEQNLDIVKKQEDIIKAIDDAIAAGKTKTSTQYGDQVNLRDEILYKAGLQKDEFNTLTSDNRSDKELESLKKDAQSKIDIQKSLYSENYKTITNYYDKQDELRQFETQKETEDRIKRMKAEEDSIKNSLAENISSNDIKIASIRNSEKEILDSIQSESDARRRSLIENNNLYQANPSNTDAQKAIAQKDLIVALDKEKRETDTKILAEQDKYTRRRLSATLETLKQEQDLIQNSALEIIGDENETYEKRLAALKSFVESRNKVLNAIKDTYDKEPENSGQTDEEKHQKEDELATAESQNAIDYGNKNAEIEKSDISSQSSEIEKLTKNTENFNLVANEELEAQKYINEEFRKGNINLEQRIVLQETIEKATEFSRANQILKAKQLEAEQFRQQQKDLTDRANKEKQGAALSYSLGQNIAGDNQTKLANVDFAGAETAGANASDAEKEVEAQKAAMQKLLDSLKDNKEQIKQIEQAGYDASIEFIDAQYKHNEETTEKNIELSNRYYDNEIANIQKSSLSAKDKAALDIQLRAEKEAADRAAAKQLRKDAHDEAVANKDAKIAEIAIETAVSVAKIESIAQEDIALAAKAAAGLDFVQAGFYTAAASAAQANIGVTIAAGAAQAAIVAAQYVPGYKYGGITKGGLARYAEGDIPELVKKPNEQPFLQLKETISFLPKGTEITPLDMIPEIKERVAQKEDIGKHFRWLAKQLKPKQNKTVVNVHVHAEWEIYKAKRLGQIK